MHSIVVVQTRMHACMHACTPPSLQPQCTEVGKVLCHASLGAILSWCYVCRMMPVTSSSQNNLCVSALQGPSRSRLLQLQQPQHHNSSR